MKDSQGAESQHWHSHDHIHPEFPYLSSSDKAIVMTTPKEIEQKIQEVRPYLEEEFGIDQIGYFGSFANGDYTEESDLDVIVAFKKKVGWKFFDLKNFLESLLDRRVDLVTERSLKRQWRSTILEQVRYL